MKAVSPVALLAWIAFGYSLLWVLRYLLGARVYLTCALRAGNVSPLARERVDPGELRLLTLADAELAAAGFHHLGFCQVAPLLTYYAAPLVCSVFVNERLPAYAIVRRHMAAEYGRFFEMDLRTDLGEQGQIVTLDTPFVGSFIPPTLRVEAYPGACVRELVERHKTRVAAASTAVAQGTSLDRVLARLQADLGELRALYRARKFAVPTADPALDRFTVRGALALTHSSRRVFAARPAGSARSAAVSPTPPIPMEEQRALRIEADLLGALQIAEYPQAPPGIPWPLLTVIAVTALLSFVAMAWLWNGAVAALILAAVTLHEAGHAAAMRMLGYRDVHVFFIPLLGAMTVGRPVATSVRNRLLVLLAGPLPGLWFAVALLALDQVYGPLRLLRIAALTLLLLNGLNLLPVTPLDGGRAIEVLSRPESVWRLVVHGASCAGLLVLAAFTQDLLIAALGVFWIGMLPRQFMTYRLRRAVAAAVKDRSDYRSVVVTTLEALTMPRYARVRAAARRLTARTLGRLFAESVATSGDRVWGAFAYVAAWIPVAVAAWLWSSHD